MKKLFFLLLFFVFTAISLFAQLAPEPGGKLYFPLTIGWSFYQSKDEYYSPLRYRGSVWSVGTGFEEYTSNEFSRVGFLFSGGSISNGAQYPAAADVRSFTNRNHILFLGDNGEKWQMFLGFTVKINFVTRNKQRGDQFDGAATLAITGAFTYKNDPTDRWNYDAVVSLPLAGWGIRPNFAASYYEKPGPGLSKIANGFIFFPKYFDLDASLNATWQMSTGNAMRFGYNWWFYKMDIIHPVRVLKQGITSTLLTRLK